MAESTLHTHTHTYRKCPRTINVVRLQCPRKGGFVSSYTQCIEIFLPEDSPSVHCSARCYVLIRGQTCEDSTVVLARKMSSQDWCTSNFIVIARAALRAHTHTHRLYCRLQSAHRQGFVIVTLTTGHNISPAFVLQ